MRNVKWLGVWLVAGAVVGQAATVNWVDWTDAVIGDYGSAVGTALENLTPVTVTYSGDVFYTTQTTGGPINYWIPSAPYVSPTVTNPPPDGDIITFDEVVVGVNTLTFSSPVTNPVMAFMSLGRDELATYCYFDAPFDVLSYGTGYFFGGQLNELPGNVLQGIEGHGTIQFLGTFTQISWTVVSAETWSGFTVGLIPEPASALLLAASLIGLRRRG